mgnify:CR=1 FL=1
MIRYLIFPLFLLGSLSSAFSQVRGIVKDIAGEPIIGANVFWLGLRQELRQGSRVNSAYLKRGRAISWLSVL